MADNIRFTKMQKKQEEDESLTEVFRLAGNDTVENTYRNIEGCLHKVSRREDVETWHLVVPKCFRERIMKANHDGPLGGHLGFSKTEARIQRSYWWLKMRKDIAEWIKTCDRCQRVKRDMSPRRGKLMPIECSYLWERIGIDIITDLPISYLGNKHLVVITDYFTKWVEAFPIPDIKARTIANILINHIICVHRAPGIITSDQGKQFTGKVMKHICRILDIKLKQTTAYHPQTDGLTERMNRTLKSMIASYTSKNQKDWDTTLPLVLFAYRNSTHESTRETPFFMMYGRDAVMPSDTELRIRGMKVMNPDEAKEQTVERLFAAQKHVREAIKKAQAKQKAYYDKTREENFFKAADVVWLKADRPEDKKTKIKLGRRWRGPYRILSAQGNTATIRHVNNPKDEQLVNVQRLKRAWIRIGDRIDTAYTPEEAVALDKEDEKRKKKSAKKGEWEVDAILKDRVKDGKTQYLVCWTGFSPRYNSWIDAENANIDNLIEIYEQNLARSGFRRASEETEKSRSGRQYQN